MPGSPLFQAKNQIKLSTCIENKNKQSFRLSPSSPTELNSTQLDSTRLSIWNLVSIGNGKYKIR